MKKVLSLIGIILFLIVIFSLVLLKISINEISKDNINLESEIKELNDSYAKTSEENNSYKERISSLRNENDELLKEKSVWQKAKEKLESALS